MRLPHRGRLQHKEDAVDAAGQVSTTWVPYRHCYARVEDQTSEDEVDNGDKVSAVATVRVSILYPRGGVLPQASHRFVFTEQAGRVRTLNIESVRRVGVDRRMMELACSEVQDG